MYKMKRVLFMVPFYFLSTYIIYINMINGGLSILDVNVDEKGLNHFVQDSVLFSLNITCMGVDTCTYSSIDEKKIKSLSEWFHVI